MTGRPSMHIADVFTTTITERLVVHKGEADIDPDEITRAMLDWYEHPGFDASRPVLWDLRDARLAVSEAELAEWSRSTLDQINAKRAGHKTAWVFGDAALARLAVDVLGSHDWRHRVRIYHNDEPAAVAWLTSSIR